MYGPVLGATTTTASALTLPLTGTNDFLQVAVLSTLFGGIMLTIVSLAHMAARRAKKGQ